MHVRPNAFLQTLNGTNESFLRFGVQSFARKRWVEYRQAGDFFCAVDAACGGRNMVRLADGFYGSLRMCTIVGVLVGLNGKAMGCLFLANAMDNIDTFWNDISAPGPEATDAIVQGSSQIYPSAMLNLTIRGGDSHAGEIKSNLVRDRLFFLFENQLGFVRR